VFYVGEQRCRWQR